MNLLEDMNLLSNLFGKKKSVVTRFAPSPTGFLTIGNYRTALFSYLFAKQHNGKFILRIEDTDKERSKKEYDDDILESFKWLGLEYDELYRQSERSERHKEYLQKLIDSGFAYISKEKEVKEGGRAEVIRFKNPNKNVTFTDLIRGDITFNTEDLGDFVIAKSLDEPLFHLAVVADDFDMGITHVIRGEDHISNTPRQILIQEAIGASTPMYAHLPLILAPDKSKLSKRNGAVSIKDMKYQGYVPEAIINFMALLGWNPGTDKEIYTFDELLKDFNLSKIQKGGAVFNQEKLNWVNKEHLRKLSVEKKLEHIQKYAKNIEIERLKRAIEVIFERIETLDGLEQAFNDGEFSYLGNSIDYNPDLLLWKKEPSKGRTAERLKQVAELIKKLPELPTAEKTKETLWDFAEKEGRGEILWPLRAALSGKEKSPDPFSLVEILGKTESITRVQNAILKLSNA